MTRTTNLSLFFFIIVCLLWYVVEANFLASAEWKIRQAERSLADTIAARDTLAAQETSLETETMLRERAQAVGMIPIGDLVYVVEPKPVAAR